LIEVVDEKDILLDDSSRAIASLIALISPTLIVVHPPDQTAGLNSSRTISQARGIGDMMVKHTFSGLCRGGPLDGQSLEHHQNVYRIFEPPSYELLGEYWHQDGKWTWRPSSNRTNDVK
jgi:hypothetical protein